MTDESRHPRPNPGEHIRTIDAQCSCCGREWSYSIPASSSFPVRRYGRHWVCALDDYRKRGGRIEVRR